MPREKEIKFMDRVRLATQEYMSRNNVTASQIATKLGCTRQNVQNFLAGQSIGQGKLDVLIELVMGRNAVLAGRFRYYASELDSFHLTEAEKENVLKDFIRSIASDKIMAVYLNKRNNN